MNCGCTDPRLLGMHYSPSGRPLTAAVTSLRESCKQMTLLELHLAVPENRCPDCITKHFLCAEAFADEAAQMDPSSPAAQAGRVCAVELERVGALWLGDPDGAAEAVRQLRKAAQTYCVRTL